MSDIFLKHINQLDRVLEVNDYNKLELSRLPDHVFPEEFELKGSHVICFSGCCDIGVNARYEVEIHANEHMIRLLGLILVVRAISTPLPAMSLALKFNSDDLIYFEPSEDNLNFYDCVPKQLEYIFNPERDEFSRECSVVEDIYRPSFGHISKQNKTDRALNKIPEWVENTLTIGGTANSALRLGTMLLDLTHPSRPGGGLMHLLRMHNQVCSLTYSLDFIIKLNDTSVHDKKSDYC